MSAHARIGPSSLARVIRCPGSVRATDGLPRRSSIYAAAGTVLHDIAADCLEFGFEPEHFFGRKMSADGFDFVIGLGDQELDPTCMIPALDWLREQPGIIFIEHRVSLEPYMPGQFGTLDIGIYDPATGLVTIFDWKFGEGELVVTKHNEQLQAYGVGFIVNVLSPLGHKPTKVRIIIEQPRARGGARYYEPWELRVEELLAFGFVMETAYTEAHRRDADIIAGEKQCRWCALTPQNGGPGCAANEEYLLDIVGQKFDDIDDAIALEERPTLKSSSLLTPKRRAFIVKNAKMFTRWLAAVHEESLAAARGGATDPGLKLVAGDKGDRKWVEPPPAEDVEVDEDDLLGAPTVEELLIQALADEAFNKKLKSPAQAEKLLKPRRNNVGNAVVWKLLGNLITQDEGKPVLVDESDDRPALKTVDEKFEDEDDDVEDEFDLLK